MASDIDDISECVFRLIDIANEPLETLLPLSGFETEPVVSLDIAVRPLQSFLPAMRRNTDR